MENNEQPVENLENLTTEELEALDNETPEPQESIDYRAKAEAAEKRAAILQRLLDKKNKTVPSTNTNVTPTDTVKDIQEIKFIHKVNTFAEDNNLTRAQAERVLKLYPNATGETLKDPFIAEGLKAIARKERVEDSTPRAGRVTAVGGQSFAEMSPQEREANFTKMYGLN
jgi:hypothetical protein